MKKMLIKIKKKKEELEKFIARFSANASKSKTSNFKTKQLEN